MINISCYSTIVFDCDGVVLNSNRIKTEAFRIAAHPWGAEVADALVAHHVANGGISRHSKFAHFLASILPQHAPGAVPGVDGPGLDELLSSYAQAVRGELMTCDAAAGLEILRAQSPDASWCIVSGGDQVELREIFASRGLDHLFDGGIFGSPDSKVDILAREIQSGTIQMPSLFLGDSRYDHEVSSAAGLDFCFIYGWTEFKQWRSYVLSHSLRSCHSIIDLLT